MNTVRSADGTIIAFTKAGQGPPLILVDGALCSRSFGPMLKAAAPTLPYDITILQDHQRRTPFTLAEWAGVKIPTLVAAGGKSPAWMTNGTRALADARPDARYRTLPGQNHMVKPQAIAPVLTEFFLARD